MLGKRGSGIAHARIRILDELFQKDMYGAIKRKAEDRSAWRILTPLFVTPSIPTGARYFGILNYLSNH